MGSCLSVLKLPLPEGIGIYTNLRNRFSYSGSPLPQILASLSESVVGGEGLGVRGMHYVNIESNDSRAHTKESDGFEQQAPST